MRSIVFSCVAVAALCWVTAGEANAGGERSVMVIPVSHSGGCASSHGCHGHTSLAAHHHHRLGWRIRERFENRRFRPLQRLLHWRANVRASRGCW